jgi:hypothetical protein
VPPAYDERLKKGVYMRRATIVILLLATVPFLRAGQASSAFPLINVKEVQIVPTVIHNPKLVKDPDAAGLVEKSLRRAVLADEFQVVDSAPVKVRISLDEFSGGSFATRFVVGFGAGRSTVDCQLQLLDQDDKEIATAHIRVRGDTMMGPYQGNTTQTKQAVSKFEQSLSDQIEKWQ